MSANGADGKLAMDANAALDGTLADGEHRFEARIYYADTDFSGAVYHARYLELLERGRSDFLRCLGVQHSALELAADPLYWIVRRIEVDYLAPAHIEDVVITRTRVDRLGKARIEMAQTIGRHDKTLIKAKVTAALINQAGRPQRFPRQWAELFAAHQS